MTFDEWWDLIPTPAEEYVTFKSVAAMAWHYQQARIDALETSLKPKLQAYVVHDSNGKIKAYTDDTGKLCIGMPEEVSDARQTQKM